MRAQFSSGCGVGVIRDSKLQAPCPAPELRTKGIEDLKALARDGQVFVIEGEEGIKNLRVELLYNQPLPTKIAELFEPVGGTFQLRVPSGRVLISGYESWASAASGPEQSFSLPPGDYALLVYSRESSSVAKYNRKMESLVGQPDWRFRNKVDRLWFIGCLPTLAVLVTLLIAPWRKFVLYLLALALLGWLPFAFMTRSRRYRSVESRRKAEEESWPIYFLELKPMERAGPLVGGFIKLQ